MRNGDDMPTAIFSAERLEYIFKPRTIYSKKQTNKELNWI